MKHPLALFTLFFCLGIISAGWLAVILLPLYFLAASLIIFCTKIINKKPAFNIFLLGLFFLSGLILARVDTQIPRSHISNFIDTYGRQVYTVKGFIKSQPRYNSGQAVFICRIQAVKGSVFSRACCGDIMVRLKSNKSLLYGSAVLLRGGLSRPYKNYLSSQGIYLMMSVKNEADFIILNKNYGFWLQKFAFFLKEHIESIFSKAVHPLCAAILEAMILGEKRNIPPLIINSMMRTGTVHILVVSGFNVGIVAFLINLMLKALRVPRRVRFAAAIFLLLIYCLATGGSNPVVRATVMAIVFLLAPIFKREPDIANSLSIAAFFILSLNPRQLFDIGFQLSFLSVIFIVYLYPKIKSFCRIDSLKIGFLKYFAEAMMVSLAAWLGTMGLVAYYFKIFSPIAVLANIFIVPLATLITLCGFSLVAANFILHPLLSFFSATTEFTVALLLKTNALLANLPGAYFYL